MTLDARATVLAYIQALSERDIEGLTALLADDVRYVIAGQSPVSGTFEGREKVLTGFMLPMSRLFDPAKPYVSTVRRVIAEGEYVVVDTVTTGTTITGNPYHNEIIAIFTVTAGRIREMSEHFDTAYFDRTLFGGDVIGGT